MKRSLAPGVLAPSDFEDRGKHRERDNHAERLRVAGRVVATGAGRLTLADAMSQVVVELAAWSDDATEPNDASEPGDAGATTVGDLLVVEAKWQATHLIEGSVVQRIPCPAPSPTSDAARFTLTDVGGHVAARAHAVTAIRKLFDDSAFLEVETPTWTPFPNLDPHLEPHAVKGGFLITSPEHAMKRMLSGGFPRIYQFAACTRDGEQGPWHEPQFTLLEWYRAFAGVEDVIRDTETLVAAVAEAAGDGALHAPDGRAISAAGPYRRLTVEDLFAQHAGVNDAVTLAERDETKFFQLWVDRIEPAIAAFDEPVFVWKYPACQAALAQRDPSDPRVAERFELYVGGVELCNGYGELTDATEQRARFEQFRAMRAGGELEHAAIDEPLLAALEAGMPPSGGNALGVDRLVALARGAAGIESVQAFPASRR